MRVQSWGEEVHSFYCIKCGNRMIMYRFPDQPPHWLICRCGEQYVVRGYCQVPAEVAGGA